MKGPCITGCKWRYFLLSVPHCITLWLQRPKAELIWYVESCIPEGNADYRAVSLLLHCYAMFTSSLPQMIYLLQEAHISCFSGAAISSSLYSSSQRYYTKSADVFFKVSWVLLDFHSRYVLPTHPYFISINHHCFIHLCYVSLPGFCS